jgi:hypothetical protein
VPLPFLSFQILPSPFPQPPSIGVLPSEWETKFRIQIVVLCLDATGWFI